MRGPAGTLGLGVALLLAAGVFDAEPLLAAGMALSLLGALAWAWVGAAASGATVQRELGATRVQEEEPLDARLEVRSPVPFPGGQLQEPLLDAPVALSTGRRAARVRVQVRFGRRGRRILAPPSVVLADPLGVHRRQIAGHAPAEVLVLPRLEPVNFTAGAGLPVAGVRAVAAPADGVEPDGLRPYRTGAPAARIHWPALARGAGLLERRLAPDAGSRPLVVLDLGGGVSQDGDRAVRAAGSLCRELARAGGCSILLPGDRRARLVDGEGGGWAAVWTALALAEGPPPVAAGALAARAGAVFLVTARPDARPPAWLAHAPGQRVVVAPGEAARSRTGRVVLEVAGCRGHLLTAAHARAVA